MRFFASLCIILIWVTINMVGAARHCYTCSTVDGSDENCEDHFTYRENSTVKIDQACDTYCIKHEVRVSTVLRSIYRPHAITRTCGPTCLDLCTDVDGMETCFYCCLENLCNVGSYRLPYKTPHLIGISLCVPVLGMLW